MPYIIEKPKTVISISIINELTKFTQEYGQVVIHGFCKTGSEPFFIRIWPTTFLFDQHSNHISELIHYQKISGFPVWTKVPSNKEYIFTLIFSGLPKSCKVFDLHEVIPENNGFYIPAIVRTKSDVYFLDFTD
ncbi:MAG: hypothetical protein IPL55_22210 [Saprospiraceae bacterium]|jgi:hypothetical protein|nr:hypothetical protein [Saprospiraceae bacterium]